MSNVKVRFELEILEDGFPPIGVETLNAQLIDGNTVKLDNTPFLLAALRSVMFSTAIKRRARMSMSMLVSLLQVVVNLYQ